MATLVNYTLPIYQAVVCNLALEKMRQEEEEEKLLSGLLESLSQSRGLLKLLSESDFSDSPAENVQQGHVALCVLVFTGRQVVSSMRNFIPSVCEKYRATFSTSVDDMAGNTDIFDEICEAWGMATEESVVTEIKKALSAVSNNRDKEVPDCREALAALSH